MELVLKVVSEHVVKDSAKTPDVSLEVVLGSDRALLEDLRGHEERRPIDRIAPLDRLFDLEARTKVTNGQSLDLLRTLLIIFKKNVASLDVPVEDVV